MFTERLFFSDTKTSELPKYKTSRERSKSNDILLYYKPTNIGMCTFIFIYYFYLYTCTSYISTSHLLKIISPIHYIICILKNCLVHNNNRIGKKYLQFD